MSQPDTAWTQSLLQEISAEPPAGSGLSVRAFKQLLSDCGFAAALKDTAITKEDICRTTLSICLGVLEGLSEPPEAGWLEAAYDCLSYGMYPVAGQAVVDERVAVALRFYFEVLDARMRLEAEGRAFDPLTDIVPLSDDELSASRIAPEYRRFVEAVHESRYITLMRLAREIRPFDPLAHTAGVHYMATLVARQAAAQGLPVDAALVSAAALAHDMGKFGCRHDDAARIPYLHYYFTDQWLQSHQLPTIAHIASNHSTWDLEFENLPAESLILIWADFLVRGERGADGSERMRIHTLEEATLAVGQKLSDMDSEKRLRYSRVTHKLLDFERYLRDSGVNPDPSGQGPLPVNTCAPSLLSDAEAVTALNDSAIALGLSLMHDISAGTSFERLIESARAERNSERIRSYLALLDEYCAYMPKARKLRALEFLYELLMHPEGDVRREAALVMGKILANSGLAYRKELPKDAPEEAAAPTLSEHLAASFSLFDAYIEKLTSPDHRIEPKHSLRIQNSLKVVIDSLFTHCKPIDARAYLVVFLSWLDPARGANLFSLYDSAGHIPAALFTKPELELLVSRAADLLASKVPAEQLTALTALTTLSEYRAEDLREPVLAALKALHATPHSAAAYQRARLEQMLGQQPGEATDLESRLLSDLYLMNLKSAVHWMVKLVNIDRLCEHAVDCPRDTFHVAMHLSNLLLVSEHLPVRERAGRALIRLSRHMSVEQRNEIVIELYRGLESLQQEYARYIPSCMGELCAGLPDMEQTETIDQLELLVRSNNIRAACAALPALGQCLIRADFDREDNDRLLVMRSERILGILLSGLAHYDDAVHRMALTVLCRDVFASDRLSLVRRRSIFMRLGKKIHTLLAERPADSVTKLHTAAMLNHLYRLIVDCDIVFGPFRFPKPGAVAFFPGTFDPFSGGHKRIVTEISALGMEIYLSIDDFSWSKRTQPKLLRRRMADMSVADCPNVFLFPDEIPVNLANPADLARLKATFAPRQIFIVAGSDVIENASAYADADLPGAANDFNHILFSRGRDEEVCRDRRPDRKRRIKGQVIELALPTYYEDVSSSRIRESIDKNLEISMLVDPLVEAYIYEQGLYIHAPLYKEVAKAQSLNIRHSGRQGRYRARSTDGAEIAAHTVKAAELLEALGDERLADHVRQQASGRILLLDNASWREERAETALLLLSELLTNSLAQDHTYALYRAKDADDPLPSLLQDTGFLPVSADGAVAWLVDMRAPLVLTCDMFERIKTPLVEDPAVISAVLLARQKLRRALCALFPGKLLLCFDTERMNHLLTEKVQAENGVLGGEAPVAPGPCMCVPYGSILSEVVIPNTVTKTLHAEKVFSSDISGFTIEETPGYAPLSNQIRAIRSFRRPVLLVDDLLHNGYRIEKLDPLFHAEGIEVKKILVGVLSGRGQDLMDRQGREVDAVYRVPNLRLWFTESLLYPFLGGDGIRQENTLGGALPSINLILPYKYPSFIHGSQEGAAALSLAALENARDIMLTLEKRHLALAGRPLTIGRLGEALPAPRLPDRGRHTRYVRSAAASQYISDDIEWLHRITGGSDAILRT